MGMRVDIVTLFPEMCQQVLDVSIIGRAARRGCIETHCHQIRDYTLNSRSRPTTTPMAAAAAWCSTPSPSPTACVPSRKR